MGQQARVTIRSSLPKDALPESLQLQFPLLAERLYLATYNRVLEECQNHLSRDCDHETLCDIAHRAASLAIEEQFQQDDEGNWHLSAVSPEIGPGKLQRGYFDVVA